MDVFALFASIGLVKTTTTKNFKVTFNKKRKAFSYSRISVQSDNDQNLSLTAQRAKARAYCELNGLELLGEFSEVYSAKNAKDREEFQKCLKAAKKEKAVIICYNLSRFARNTSEALFLSDELKKAGCDLVLIQEQINTDTSSGRLFFTLCASFAEYERQLISERTRMALGVKREANKRISGRIPYGFKLAKNGVDLIPVPKEAKVIARMKNLKAEGFTFVKISQILNAEKIKTKNGKKWFPATIRNTLARQAKLPV